MGFFNDDAAAEKIGALQLQLQDSETKRKKLGQALIEERKRTESQRIELSKASADLAAAKRSAIKARTRQKSSVERANRFKSRLAALSSLVQ